MEELNNFIKRVDSAAKARSKDIRLNMAEAQTMVSEIALLLSRENDLLKKLAEGPAQMGIAEDITVEMDGGTF
jgi:FixJ family two-component response regulator